jgi:hypothetical protein
MGLFVVELVPSLCTETLNPLLLLLAVMGFIHSGDFLRHAERLYLGAEYLA